MTDKWSLVLNEAMYGRLGRHLFRDDGDEHGAVILAGIARSHRGVRLLARHLILAEDGTDYVPGERGYRLLKGEFITPLILRARNERLAYLAIHNHGGLHSVALSDDDLRSHVRGYPTLLDVGRGVPVGGLVFARRAVAGDIWLPGGNRIVLDSATIVGRKVEHLRSIPAGTQQKQAPIADDRQRRLLGADGLQILRGLKIGIIGVGGVGSILVELLARLGVGSLVVADPDRVDITNLPRLVGASYLDALSWLTGDHAPKWVRALGKRWAKPKVVIAARSARKARPGINVDALFGDVADPEVATQFTDCDYIFLAADSMQARLIFNALVHQYLIPGVQIGSKATSEEATGALDLVYSVVRPISPGSACLNCSGLISADGLQQEGCSPDERRHWRYGDDPDTPAPSVITLNAVGASHAADDFLFTILGLTREGAHGDFVRYIPLQRTSTRDVPRAEEDCLQCGTGPGARFALGDGVRLPVRMVGQPTSRRLSSLRSLMSSLKRLIFSERKRVATGAEFRP